MTNLFDLTSQELFGNSKPAFVESIKERRTYCIEVDDDTHWELVRIAAKNKQHQEDFVEQLLVEFVAGVQAANATNEAQAGNLKVFFTSLIPSTMATDEELDKLWNSEETWAGSLRALYNLGIAHGQAGSREQTRNS